MSSVLDQIEGAIVSKHLLNRGQPVLVAVSGGCDSMVLLHALHAVSAKHKWRLTVAHLNHQLRGRSSDADERLVRETARRLKLSFVSQRVDVRAFARSKKLSIEMAARELRHEFLAQAARARSIRAIALAHHADDQLELFFLRLFRGSGSEGLAGMKWKSPSPGAREITLIRPLLALTKAQLVEFANEARILFREDKSNAALDFQRNRIRHELLPLLRKHYQAALDKTVLRTMELLGAEAEFVASVAKERLAERTKSVSSRQFSDLPVAVQRKGLQLQLIRLGISADFDLVEKLRTSPGVPICLARKQEDPAEALASVILDDGGNVRVSRQKQVRSFDSGVRPIRLSKVGGAKFHNLLLRWQMSRRANLQGRKTPRTEFFDADKIGSCVILRHWQRGDRFQPIGMSKSVKLQDFFTNQKVPREQRHEVVLATTGSGEIFWVEGQRISDRFKLNKGTKCQLKWRWERLFP